MYNIHKDSGLRLAYHSGRKEETGDLSRALTADSIKQEFEQTLPKRVERYLEVKPHIIIPNAPFAVPSSECSFLYRDGHFYACIALVQAVAEAIVRYICDIDFGKHGKVFEKNVDTLYDRKFISDALKESLLRYGRKETTTTILILM